MTPHLELTQRITFKDDDSAIKILKIRPQSPDSESSESVKSLIEGTLMSPLLPRVINAVRFLSADTVLHAKSGHTGMPMGMAPAACTLWDSHLKFNPKNPFWVNRDRFVLSAGHGSMLLYSLLHLYGYSSVTTEDLTEFRKLGSRAPGHPENILTPGVEVTTGALGQGICNAVGMALAESHLSSVYNRPGHDIIDHYTFCVVGDGCLMEGISYEACSLAGHWKLGKLIVLYDDNSISIEGSTDLAFTEDVCTRFIAQGWHVQHVADGNTDLQSLNSAILSAKAVLDRPSLIKVSTIIGYGTPTLHGTATIHGPCLDKEEISKAKKSLGWEAKPFQIPDDVKSHTYSKIDQGVCYENQWKKSLDLYREAHPKLAGRFERDVQKLQLPMKMDNVISELCSNAVSRDEASRKTSGRVLNAISEVLPTLIGGSADLSPSTVTTLTKEDDYQHSSPHGRNIHFGVREHAMGSICNGIALHGGGLIPFCSTFLVFSDYCRAAIRTAALSHARVLYVLTHDSVLLGQDGPTHQPVEHLLSLRSIPHLNVIRPADQVEIATGYELALSRIDGPTILVLSRQAYQTPLGSRVGTKHGGYIHSDNTIDGASPDIILIGTGSELGLIYETVSDMKEKGYKVRIVSMPCVEIFKQQGKEYRDSIIGDETLRPKRLVVEAGSSLGWYEFSNHILSVNDFGVSAPTSEIKTHFGLTKANLFEKVSIMIGAASD